MNYKAKTVYIFSSHPLLNWAMGVLFASIVSIFVVMTIESYLINGRISDWNEAEIKHVIAEISNPPSHYSRKGKEVTAIRNDRYLNDIDKIEAFYDRRFISLLWTMGTLVTLAGIVLPILLTIIQQQSAKTEKKNIENGIKEIENLRFVLEEKTKQNKEQINSLYKDFYIQNAQNYHGLAESWFRQYQESGGVAVAGAAIVYSGLAIKYNQKANNAKGLRSNILMLKRIDTCLSEPIHSNDKTLIVSHLSKYKWTVSSSDIRSCLESNGALAEEYINSSIMIYEKIMDTYGVPNNKEDD